MLDEFTKMRIVRLLETWKAKHGRDASAAELEGNGLSQKDIKQAVHAGLVTKYSATTKTGSQENRFKLTKNWKSLNT